MNDQREDNMAPHTFIYGISLKDKQEVVFNPPEDGLEHQLDLKTACVMPETADELQMVTVEGQNSEGQSVEVAMLTLKPSCLPCVGLGSFTITPPAVFRLTVGQGPVCITGQHLIMMEKDQSLIEEEDDEVEEEDEVEEKGDCNGQGGNDDEVKIVKVSKKRPADSPSPGKQKKRKVTAPVESNDDKTKPEKPRAKAKPKAKQNIPASNGKSPAAPAVQAPKKAKTPKQKVQKKTEEHISFDDVVTRLQSSKTKGMVLPKAQAKFENFLKNCHHVTDPEMMANLWKWRREMLQDGEKETV